MGCTGSKPVAAEPSPSTELPPLKGDAFTAPRPRQARLSIAGGFNQNEDMKKGKEMYDNDTGSNQLAPGSSNSVAVDYAFLSQRGLYPDQPTKPNQDAVVVREHINGYSGQHLIGVLDGHGETGAECAQFAKAKLPMLLAGDVKLRSDPQGALERALLATNDQLHRAPIDDTLSGTTACLALLQDSMLYVANVGDSRAVLAQRCPAPSEKSQPESPESAPDDLSSLLAVELTTDQTPFREDECERVQLAGARVMTLDQMEGLKERGVRCWTNEADCDGDPPRLWAPTGTYPGTAFTRSIGDSVAEAIGVFAQPEISSIQITDAHPFLILASDGVWEFINSQRAVDIVASCKDPTEAARALVSTAYKAWLQKETRTDDISVAVLYFSFPEANE